MFNTEQLAYKALREIVAERTNPLVAWIGAGVSQSAGLPSWMALREKLLIALKERIVSALDSERALLKGQLDAILEQENLWVAFQLLRDAVGRATYISTIRESLGQADKIQVPQNYKLLVKLPWRGMINLNLDRLATRAFSEAKVGELVNEFTGQQAGSFTHLLKAPTPFIANLHGIVASEPSWVFTHDSLKELFRNHGYRNFVQTCAGTMTIVFAGITADDVAAGGHLEYLTMQKIDTGPHFWITDRRDQKTIQWAEGAGIRTIVYNSDAGNHAELTQLLGDLCTYMPQEKEAPPVEMQGTNNAIDDLPSPDALLRESNETIRERLNAHATRILSTHNELAYQRYAEFCKMYDQAIYRAWYVSLNSPSNNLLGYRLTDEIDEGAFGRVFRAVAADGSDVAIKLLKEDVRRKPEMLQGFRRGVKSMRILSDRNIEGMVPYVQASEIPAFAVMSYVEGPNLRRAVEAQFCTEWETILRIAVDLTAIIRRAHQVPERVLHRDIRPPNIMLQGYYEDATNYRVVVLDFDLSWHMGATEVSVVDKSTLSGFLAPEQVERSSKVSTRNAAVDSYGVGMTLFFMRSGKEPRYNQPLHKGWQNDLTQEVAAHKCRTWQSLPNRFARLIYSATRERQADRWDMAQIYGELDRLKEALASPSLVRSAELLTEEVVCRAMGQSQQPYEWHSDTMLAIISLPSGVRVEVQAEETGQRIVAHFEWSSAGDREYKQIRKYMSQACDQATAALKKHQWRIQDATVIGLNSVYFSAEIQEHVLQGNLDSAANGLEAAIQALQF